MKKNLVLGTLIAVSVFQTATPAMADKQDVGNIIGGIIGGLAGSKVGKGNGNTAAIIFGTIAGSMIGSQVGRDMDQADRRAFEDAQRRCFQGGSGRAESWSGQNYGSRTGARGTFTSMREGRNMRTQESCTEYRSEIYVNGRSEVHSGIACSRRDGSYYEVNMSEVSFGNMNQPGGGYAGGVRPGPPRGPGGGGYPPRPPVRRDYQAQTVISNIQRTRGGQWYRVSLDRPASISEIQLYVLNSRLRIIDARAYTDRGQTVSLYDLTGNLVNRDSRQTRSLPRERIQGLDLLLEVTGPTADLQVMMTSQDGPISLWSQRF